VESGNRFVGAVPPRESIDDFKIDATAIAVKPLLQIGDHPAFTPYRALFVEHATPCATAQMGVTPLRFVDPPAHALSAIEFERRIVERGEIIVRPDNIHDEMNALVWRTFPKTKFAISKAHVALGETTDGKTRPRRRDVLTLFDEAGLIMLSMRGDLREMNEQHRWRELFVVSRRDFIDETRPILFGHGAMEQLLSKPHRGLTVKALWLPLSVDTPLNVVDAYLAARVESDTLLTSQERRVPLPLLGVPGWFAENENPACYEDVETFRPLRTRT
jgi:hypothetical protein